MTALVSVWNETNEKTKEKCNFKDALHIASISLDDQYWGTVKWILENKKDRSKQDQSFDTTLSFFVGVAENIQKTLDPNYVSVSYACIL